MLQLNTPLTPPPTWGAILQRGDVVLFRFPCAEERSFEKPKRRTCLVLEIEDIDGHRFVELAYGTSVDNGANTGEEIHVVDPDEMAEAGTRRPTRFVCSRRVTVALEHPGWDTNPAHPSPIVGRLPEIALPRLNAIRARIHALRDIAADRRASRRKTFAVEHRRRRTLALPRKAVRK